MFSTSHEVFPNSGEDAQWADRDLLHGVSLYVEKYAGRQSPIQFLYLYPNPYPYFYPSNTALLYFILHIE